MVDGMFRGDLVLEGMEYERRELVASLVRERRVAALDACLSIAAFVACLGHAYGRWAILFEIFHVAWIPFVLLAICAISGAWNAVEATRLHRWFARIS